MTLHTPLDHSIFFSESFFKAPFALRPMKLWVGVYPEGKERIRETLAGVIGLTNPVYVVVSKVSRLSLLLKPWIVRTHRFVFQCPILTFCPSYHRPRVPHSVCSRPPQGKESGRARLLLDPAQSPRHRRTCLASGHHCFPSSPSLRCRDQALLSRATLQVRPRGSHEHRYLEAAHRTLFHTKTFS